MNDKLDNVNEKLKINTYILHKKLNVNSYLDYYVIYENITSGIFKNTPIILLLNFNPINYNIYFHFESLMQIEKNFIKELI